MERRRSAAPKRSRSVAPAPEHPVPTVPFWPPGLRGPIGALESLTNPPRQLWLAALGTTAVTVRKTTELWSRLVAEGATVERALRVPDFGALLRRGEDGRDDG